MKQLKRENQTWTALIDSDEYIVPNVHAKWLYRLRLRSASATTSRIKRKTVLEYIQQASYFQQDRFRSPCISMPRLLIGTKESTDDEISKLVPSGFNATDFLTLRWRWHGDRQNTKLNQAGKTMIDVSRVNLHQLSPIDIDPHRPVRAFCKENDMWIQNEQAPFVVHHYIGTYEQWSFRDDPRKTFNNGTRSRQRFDSLAYDTDADDNIRSWLQDFVDTIGYKQAKELLKGVGHVVPSAN